MKKQIIFWGTPLFAVPILSQLINLGVVSAVVTQPDRLQGRGRKTRLSSPVKQLAEQAGLPVLAPEKLSEPGFRQALEALGSNVFVVAAYGKIIPQSILDLSAPRAINVHPSLLPKYRGPSPIQAALLAQDKVTGVTLIQLDDQMDHGPIIAQEQVEISPEDTAVVLSEALSLLAAKMLATTLPSYLAGQIELKVQDHAQATYCKLIQPEDAALDLSKTVAELYAHIRAMQPWPGSYVQWNALRLKIHGAKPLPGIRPTALFTRSQAGNLLIRASDGAIEALTVQLEGKPSMPSVSFLNGYPAILDASTR